MQAATFMGEIQGYILVSTLIYVAFDKTLAVRLALLVTLTMCLNHVVKILVKNPRPFIREGTYLKKWAVSPQMAQDLAREYSTPSGHAMAGASFYTYLFGRTPSHAVKIAAVLAILLIGISRRYLGVHYVEDILLGWAVGLGVALFALRYDERIAGIWMRLGYAQQIGVTVAASLVLWAVTFALNGWTIDGEPRAFLGYAGTITGIVIARPLELRFVNFDPKSMSVPVKVLRYVLAVALSLLVLEGLGKFFAAITPNYSVAGYVLQYLRYIGVGVVSLFVAPWIFTRIGLAKTVGYTVV